MFPDEAEDDMNEDGNASKPVFDYDPEIDGPDPALPGTSNASEEQVGSDEEKPMFDYDSEIDGDLPGIADTLNPCVVLIFRLFEFLHN